MTALSSIYEGVYACAPLVYQLSTEQGPDTDAPLAAGLPCFLSHS